MMSRMTDESEQIQSYIKSLFQAEKHARALLEELGRFATLEEKITYLFHRDEVKFFLQKLPGLKEFLDKLPQKSVYTVLQCIALGQLDALSTLDQIQDMQELLLQVEEFYEPIGGLIGYHTKVLELVHSQLVQDEEDKEVSYRTPPVFDIRQNTQDVRLSVQCAINMQDKLAEIYPIGGAGDRLDLRDERTKRPLPAALLEFCGRSLFEMLFRDLRAREYVHYKLTGTQCITPVVLMTSLEKNNAKEIEEILQEHLYFGRPKTSIFSLVQPLVPVIGIDGVWIKNESNQLVAKPGGHGVIWRLAHVHGAFDWLRKQQKEFLLVRQLNNPLAGLDSTMLALVGFGIKEKKDFVFTSVPPKVGAAEGLTVLVEQRKKDTIDIGITNVEYTEFAKKKYAHKLLQSNAAFANTNILFARMSALEQAAKELPFPGMIVNMKHKQKVVREQKIVELPCVRLETTMQNIADAIQDRDEKHLRTGIVLSAREKTISVTKKSFSNGQWEETPESAFYDLMKENRNLLQHCGYTVPPMNSMQEYLQGGPTALFLYHPSLGPLYSIISQKLRRGSLAPYAELQLEVAEADFEQLHVTGSLLIAAKRVEGSIDPKTHELRFHKHVGCCKLKNVTVSNKGIDREKNNRYWKNEIARREACQIILEGESAFIGEDIHLEGDLSITVPSGMCCHASMSSENKLVLSFEPLQSSGWNWKYEVSRDAEIQIRPFKRSDLI